MKKLVGILLGLLVVGAMAGITMAVDNNFIQSKQTNQTVSIEDIRISEMIKKELGISITPQEIAGVRKVTLDDLKKVEELKAQGINASRKSLLKLILTTKMVNLIAEKTNGNPMAVMKFLSILGNQVKVEPVQKTVAPLSGDYQDLLLNMWVMHVYQNDPEIPYYIIVYGGYLWKETETPGYEGSDDVVYFIWNEADELVLFNDRCASPEMRRAGSNLGAIAYYTPDSLHSGYAHLSLLPKTSSVSGRYTRVSMNYVHTYGIGGQVSITIGYKYVSVTYSPKIGGKWTKSTYKTFKIDPEGKLK